MHLQPLYSDVRRYGGDVAESLYETGICLPSSSSLSAAEQSRVIDAIRSAANGEATFVRREFSPALG
jgi:pyridoxal phosphate-dependent aminotransferase EpsN